MGVEGGEEEEEEEKAHAHTTGPFTYTDDLSHLFYNNSKQRPPGADVLRHLGHLTRRGRFSNLPRYHKRRHRLRGSCKRQQGDNLRHVNPW